MVDKKQDLSEVGYMFGIISIVLAFFSPVAGFIFGIIGLVQSKKQNTELSKKAKKFNILGIILSIVVLVISFFVMIYLGNSGAGSLFPSI